MRHEVELFVLCSRLVRAGRTVVIVTHSLGLAARLSDRVLLFDRGRLARRGRAAEVLTEETFSRVYGWPIEVVRHPGPGPDGGSPLVCPALAERARAAVWSGACYGLGSRGATLAGVVCRFAAALLAAISGRVRRTGG